MKLSSIVKTLLWICLASVLPAGELPALIPAPSEIRAAPGECFVSAASGIRAEEGLRRFLAEELARRCPAAAQASPAAAAIRLEIAPARSGASPESYTLDIQPRAIVAKAPGKAGLINAVHTLRQLLDQAPAKDSGRLLPCLMIDDSPRFAYRGVMLDPARYFIPAERLKSSIDRLSYYKINKIHLHLTDNSGWRISIAKHPELTDAKKWPSFDPARGAGFYTREEIRELVAYASARNVQLIPEIDIPQHCSILTHLIPQLRCPVENQDDEICASRPEALDILKGIIADVAGQFPGSPVHIGGDEYLGVNWKYCPSCQRRAAALARERRPELDRLYAGSIGTPEKYLLYRDLMRRVAAHVTRLGRVPCQWDELSWQGDYPAGAWVFQWHFQGGRDFFVNADVAECPAADAARHGHPVVVCPFNHFYLDLPSSVEGIYGFDPVPKGLEAAAAARIAGVQVNNWDCPPDRFDFRLYPKALALAELGWSRKEALEISDFKRRLAAHYPVLDEAGIDFDRDPRIGGKAVAAWDPDSIARPLSIDLGEACAQGGRFILSPLFLRGRNAAQIRRVAVLVDGQEVFSDAREAQTGAVNIRNHYAFDLPPHPGSRCQALVELTGVDGSDSHGEIFLYRRDRKP